MGLLTEYPLWFILLCLLLGAVYAFSLYFNSGEGIVRPGLRIIMAGLRFLTVFIISFLLLSPLIRQNLTTIEKPVIIIGQDNSQSLILGSDSAYIKGEYLRSLNELINSLEDTYDVRTYSFGDGLKSPMATTFDEKVTDISHFFAEISTRYVNRNVGAIILASDGIYNFGTDPYYTARDLPYPVYTVALGDTTDRCDILVNKVFYNREVFRGDDFPVEIQVYAIHCDGEKVKLTVNENSNILASQEVEIRGNHFSRQIPIRLKANEPGWHRYSVIISPVSGELSKDNNRQDFFIEVMDVRTKVVIVSDAPHPDIGAIRQALESSEKFDVIERSPEEFLLSGDSVALVIFYQVPSTQGIRISESVISSLPAALFILGSQSDILAFNKLNPGMVLSMTRLSYSESYPVFNEAFPYFTISESLVRIFSEFPPLQCPFGSYQYASLTEVLAHQRINGVLTRFPLVSFTFASDQKRGFITGENFWRWRIACYAQTGDHLVFDELVQKVVQYLAVKQDKSYFRVKMKSEFIENESVEIQAEVYNQSYELINEPDVTIVITDENDNRYPYTFRQTGSAYFLKAGTFPPGVYTYRASVINGPDRYEKRGSFVVTPVNLEAVNLSANHNLLYRIAESHRGTLLLPDEMGNLSELLKQNEEIHAVSYVQRIFSELINAPWVFLLILGLLTGEWAIRKYSGI